jgi:hypothetical protein
VMPIATGFPSPVAIPAWPAPVIRWCWGHNDRCHHDHCAWWRAHQWRRYHDWRRLADHHAWQRDSDPNTQVNAGLGDRDGPE